MKLSECISVAPRYSRAINLERVLHSEVAVQGYVLTSTGLDCIARIADAVDRPSGGTAWTLTGPYGTGKSAFALYMTRLLGNREDSKEARKLLQNELVALESEGDPELRGTHCQFLVCRPSASKPAARKAAV
jgi:hypothetical protein